MPVGRAAGACGCAERAAGAGAACAGAAFAAGAPGLTAGAALAVGAGASFSPGPTTRRFTFSTTTALERPWEKLWRTTPCSTGRFSVRVLEDDTCNVLSPGVLVSLIPPTFLYVMSDRRAPPGARTYLPPLRDTSGA